MFSKIGPCFFAALGALLPALGAASEAISPEKFMGGADDLRLLLSADFVSIEKVSATPAIVDIKWENGDLKSTEVGRPNWKWGMPLTVEKGPIPIPDALTMRIKNLFRRSYVSSDWGLSCGYLPCYKITLKDNHHVLEIYILRTVYDFEVYRDGVRIGGRPPDEKLGNFFKEIDSLFDKSDREPGKSTPPSSPGGS